MSIPTEDRDTLKECLLVRGYTDGPACEEPRRERGYRTFTLADLRKLEESSFEGWLTCP